MFEEKKEEIILSLFNCLSKHY